jgi:hypothetical protein
MEHIPRTKNADLAGLNKTVMRYEILIAQFDENTEETESKRKNRFAQE